MNIYPYRREDLFEQIDTPVRVLGTANLSYDKTLE